MNDKQKEIKVELLNIKIGGREINLSIEEAKKLKGALEDIFGKEIIKEVHDYWHYYNWKPYRPYWGKTWCSNDNTTYQVTSTIAYKSNILCMSIT